MRLLVVTCVCLSTVSYMHFLIVSFLRLLTISCVYLLVVDVASSGCNQFKSSDFEQCAASGCKRITF